MRLLGRGGVGRIAFAVPPEPPIVFPVNYRVVDEDIVIRTARDSQLADVARRRTTIAFEVDRVDEQVNQGWSVLAQGPVGVLGGEDAARLRDVLAPWAGGDRPLVVRLYVQSISGRRISAV